MKCPKCGYLGFETSERCRNCGYDFSLAAPAVSVLDLTLRPADAAEAPLADLELAPRSVPPRAGEGVPDPHDVSGGAEDRAASTPRPPSRSHRARPTPGDGLPLFAPEAPLDDAPLITTPRPARPPLAVRRTTPEVARSRPRATPPPRPAGLLARVLALAIDALLLGGIHAAVVYFTLAVAGLSLEQLGLLPLAPLAGFAVILSGGYLVGFIAASGQTIGKMAAGIRVIGDDGARVDVPGAVLRAVGCFLSVLSAGLGYLPAFLGAERRALQDRLSGTRVVRAR